MDKTNFADSCGCIYPRAKKITDGALDGALEQGYKLIAEAEKRVEEAEARGDTESVDLFRKILVPELEKGIKEIKAIKESFDQIPTCKKK